MLENIFCVCKSVSACFFFFFFNDTATTEIYTLSLHDALPIYRTGLGDEWVRVGAVKLVCDGSISERTARLSRSEEHTSELQSQSNLVCRLLLEKKKTHTKSADQEQRQSITRIIG